MATPKKFKGLVFVKSTHHGRSTIYCASMNEMLNGIFGYTLECGNSWNDKINRYPKTVRGLVNALNKSAYECRRYYDCYDVSSYEEFIAAGGEIEEGKGGRAYLS